MANQYVAIVEEATAGTDPGSGYLFIPITGKLQPTFTAKDEPRKEFRGADTALGASSVVRRESSWSYTLECSWYPGVETGLLFKHLMGKAGTRSTVDTSGKKGILYPLSMPYGTGAELGTKRIGVIANTDEGGTTKSQYFGGGVVKSCTISIKGTDDVKLSFELTGPGEYVGDPDQTATAGASFPAASPFISADVLCYIGAGITRTGSAPAYTAFAPNTMTQFLPDELTIKITNGLDLKMVLNGIMGPSKPVRSNQFEVGVDFPIDYEDPASGFSSADEFKAIFTGAGTNALLVKLASDELAGSTNAYYEAWLDLPLFLRNPETPERTTDGKTPSVKMAYKSLYSSTTQYPVGLLTQDQAAAY